MNRLTFRSSLLPLAMACCWIWSFGDASAQHVVEEEPLTPQQELATFRLPPGFEAQLVAAEPQIAKPINLNFDSQGRLYVTQSLDYPYAAQGKGRDAVVRLTIDPATGRASKVETVVSELTIPIGVTPLADGLAVFGIPNLYRYRDTTGDGRYNQREKLFGPFGQADTHGLNNALTRWIDGWVYACHGFRNESHVSDKAGHKISMTSGNTYRFRPDGSHIEHYTHGQVNPFGMCFDPLGNVYTSDCHSKPAYMLLRGAHYPSFGKPHDGLGFGPTLIEHTHGSTGIAGIVYYAADLFPSAFHDQLFIGNPITHRINCDKLEQHGSTYRGIEQPDFLTSDDKWFRPVDLQLGPDGALYVADFYNRIIGHYEVPLDHPGRDRHRGRIWRIVYRGDQAREPLPRLDQADLQPLIERLADPNLTVRTLATHELVDRFGEAAVAPVRSLVQDRDSTPKAVAHGLWVLERLGKLDEKLVNSLASSVKPIIRVHLIKALSERKTWTPSDFQLARKTLSDKDPFVRRAAADALGRHPSFENVLPLLDLWSQTPAEDTHLTHVTRMALRDQLMQPGVIAKITPLVKARAHRDRLRNICLGTRTNESAAYVLESWSELPEKSLGVYLHFVSRHIADERLKDVQRTALGYQQSSFDSQSTVLTSIHRGLGERGKPLPEDLKAWATRLAGTALTSDEPKRKEQGLQLTRTLRLASLYEPIVMIVNGKNPALRPSAIDACVDIAPQRSTATIGQVVANGREPISLRQRAAVGLGRINSEASRRALLHNLVTSPEPLALVIARELATHRAGAEKLLASVASGKASPRLLKDRDLANRLLRSGMPDAKESITRLTTGLPENDPRIVILIAERRNGFTKAQGDPILGKKIFAKTCAACHRVGNQGAKIGPELDGIGNRGLDRVLEDILDPSRNVDGAFRTTVIATNDGRTLRGLLLRREGEVLVLADDQGKEIRVANSDVDEQIVSPLSPMPANVPQLVKGQDFYHLLAYLLAQRQAKPPMAE